MRSVQEAQADAQEMAREFIDQICEQLIDNGKASTDLFNDYPNGDAYHHESHVDRDYDLTEAAAILDEYSEDEETDSGLWEGCEPRRAISTQAAYTYGNAVYGRWQRIIEEINDDDEVQEILNPERPEGDDAEEITPDMTKLEACINAVIDA